MILASAEAGPARESAFAALFALSNPNFWHAWLTILTAILVVVSLGLALVTYLVHRDTRKEHAVRLAALEAALSGRKRAARTTIHRAQITAGSRSYH